MAPTTAEARRRVNGVGGDNRQSNSRVGITFSLPLTRHQSLKFTWSDGASTRLGTDFTNYGIAWQYTLIN